LVGRPAFFTKIKHRDRFLLRAACCSGNSESWLKGDVMALRTGLLTLLLLGSPAALGAEPITLTATGTLEVGCSSCLQSLLGFTAPNGSSFTVSISFNPEARQQTGSAIDRLFSFGPGTATLLVGGRMFALATLVDGGVQNDVPVGGSPLDQIFITAASADPALTPGGFTLSGSDLSGRLLQSLDWPHQLAATLNAAPSRLAFGNRFAFVGDQFAFELGRGVTFAEVPGPAPTPEPSAIILFTTAVLGGFARRCARRLSLSLRAERG
jgi:hypothetical protein